MKIKCPQDTDGDGNCGCRLCPACGSDAPLPDKLCREIVRRTHSVGLILNDTDTVAHTMRMELFGEIHGLRVALALVMDWDPDTAADKEEQADDYVKDWHNRIFPAEPSW